MIRKIINYFFNKKITKVCECHGYPIKDDDSLPVQQTAIGFKVCPNAALESSLNQMGNGTKLSPEIAEELRKKINNEVVNSDSERLNFLENNKQYVVGFAPSGDFSLFDIKTGHTAYGKTIRQCIDQGIIMHKDITK